MMWAIWTPRGALLVEGCGRADVPGPTAKYSTWKTRAGAEKALARVRDWHADSRYAYIVDGAVVGPDVVGQHLARFQARCSEVSA